MAGGRRWTPGDFARYFAGHPLLRHIVPRLVWTVSNGDSFRVCEDSTYADSADEPYTPPADITVGVAHPLDLGGTAAAWAARCCSRPEASSWLKRRRAPCSPPCGPTGSKMRRRGKCRSGGWGWKGESEAFSGVWMPATCG